MDINVEIKEEIQIEEPSVIKSEEKNEDIFHLDIKSERNFSIEETQTSSLYWTSVKKDSDDDNVYESDTDITKLKEEFISSEENGETLTEIKTEELMLKSESEDDERNTGAYGKEVRNEHTITNIHEILLENEMLEKHDESTIAEQNCDYRKHRDIDYKNHNKTLNSHILGNYDRDAIKKYSCSYCDFISQYKVSLKRHIMIKHEMSLKEKNCDLCDYKTHFRNNLISLVNFKHTKLRKKYNCNQCDYKAHNNRTLNSHVLAKHDNSAIKIYNCNLCVYKTNNKYLFNNHILAKHDESSTKKYNCNLCDYKTNIKRLLYHHVSAKHDGNAIKKYNCNYCDYKTDYKNCFNRHVLVRHDRNAIKKHNCQHCDYKSHSKGNLSRHVSTSHDKGCS